MSVSRFFCETLLSDYHEGLLPPGRRAEIEEKLQESRECRDTYDKLQASLKCLKRLPLKQVPPDVALQVMDICEGRGKVARAGGRKRLAALLFLLVVCIGGLLTVPAVREQIPYFSSSSADNTRFVRYYPLYQGAQEILEEQATWIQLRDSLAVNFWEEGGFTPLEFERSFQLGHLPVDTEEGTVDTEGPEGVEASDSPEDEKP